VRVTPLGWGLIALVVAGLALAAFGPASVQPWALVGAAIAVALMVGGWRARSGPWGTKSLAERREEFGPEDRSGEPGGADAGVDVDALWQRERARRRADGRGP
jgi:hypothetical protein